MTNPLYNALFAPHLGAATPFLRLADGRVITHDEFLTTTANFANAIRDMGIEPGDRIAVQVEKSPEALAVYAACVQSGCVFLPLNTAYTPSEVSYFIEDSGAKLFICDVPKAGALQGIADAAGAQLQTLSADGAGSFADLARTEAETTIVTARDGSDLAALLYTSGTTGRSKGAMLTHDNLLSNAKTLADCWRFTSDDILLHALPIFHTHGLFVASNVMLLAGGSMIFLPRFDLDQMLAGLPQATAMMGVPTFYTRLLDDDRFTRERTAHMRLFISGSAPLLAETHQLFSERTGHAILERYGMTETNMNSSNPYEGARLPGTVGMQLPGVEIKITDPASGEELPQGETGMIEVRGPNVFIGYWQMPEKTAEELRENGFFITGDLGVIDPDGYVRIVGRSKDLIISGGYNIYPKEIELLLDEQPGVQESAVVGVPHADFGEAVLGLLVAKTGTSLDTAAILKAIGPKLARFKQPRQLVQVDQLPRNTMGKVQKNLLRDQFKNALGA